MSKFLDFLKDLGEGIVQEGGQEVADILSVRNLPDAALATLSAAKLATGVPLIIDHYTNNSLDRAETWVEDKLSNTLDRVPVLKTANWVAQKAALQPWETAQQDPSWGSFKNALDSTGNDFAGIVGYGVNAFKEAPSAIGNAAIEQAKAAYALSQAMITGQSPKEIGSKLLDFGEALFGPWLTLVSQPVIDVHSAFGEDAYQYLKTGEWNGSGLIPFNLPAEYAQLHPEMRDQMIAAYEQGYDSNQDGVADFTGGRAVWEFVIGHEHRFAKTFFEFANDPWTATLAIGLVEAGVKGLPKLAFFANSPAAKRILLNTAKAIGIINRTQQVTQDLPFVLAKYAGKGLGKAAFKVAPEASKTVSATAAGIRGAGKTIAANAINGPLNSVLGLTDQYIAQRESTAAASALDRIRDVGTNESLLIARHQPKNPIPDSYDPFSIHRRYYNPLPDDAGKYTVVGDRSTPLHIADPNGNIVSEFAGYNGPKKFRAAQDAADSLNRYLENTGIEFPSMGPPPKVRKPTPPPVGPLVDDPNAASIVDTTAETNPANVYVPDVVGDKATKTPAPLTGNDANPDWWEYQPRMTANGTLDPTDNRGLTQLVREWSQAKGNKKKQYETLFKRIGYDPVANQPIPGGKLAQHEAKRRAIISKFYGAAEPGTSIEAAIELGGGFDRKVMNEYIASLQHAFFDLTPEYQKLFKTRDWPWDFSASGLPTPSGVIPLEQVTEEQVIDIGRRLYQQGWGASGLPGQTLGDRAAIIRGLINLAIYRNDEVGMAAMRVLGRHGWPDGQSGAFIVNYAFKHAPEPMLGYSGGQTAAVYRGKGVREAEPQMRDELSPMDWIGTMRRYYYGRDALRTIPVPSRVPGAAAATIAPAVGPAAPDNPLVARSNELLQATNNTKLTAEQVAPLTQLQQNLARATGGGEEMLDSYRFTTEPEPASPNALAQSEQVIEATPNRYEMYKDPELRRAQIAQSITEMEWIPGGSKSRSGESRKIFWGNIINRPEVSTIRDDLIDAFVSGDKGAFDRIVNSTNLSPRQRAELKTNFWDALNKADESVSLGIGKIDEDIASGKVVVPKLKTYDDLVRLMSQPVPDFLVEADMKRAVDLYPDLSPEDALAQLRANGLDDFSRMGEITIYEYTTQAGKKKIRHKAIIPGGFKDNGRFSYWELGILDAQGINPASLPWDDRVALYQKIFRSMDRSQEYDPIDLWTRLGIGVTSSSAELYQNLRVVAALRPTSNDEMQRMAAFVEREWPEWAQAMRSYNFEPTPGQLGGGIDPNLQRSGADYQNLYKKWIAENGIDPVVGSGVISDNIGKMLSYAWYIVRDQELVNNGAYKHPVLSQIPGEDPMSYVDRLSAILPGLQSKTANFGAMLGDPSNWKMGTMDVHMMRWLRDLVDYYQNELSSPEIYKLIPDVFKENGRVRIPQSMLDTMKETKDVYSASGDMDKKIKVFVQAIYNATGKEIKPALRDGASKKDPNSFLSRVARGERATADPRRLAVELGTYRRNSAEVGETVDYAAEYWPLSDKSATRTTTKEEQLRGAPKVVPYPPSFAAVDEGYKAASELTTVIQHIMAKDLDIPEILDFTAGGFQWFIWDSIRGVLETHPIAFPNLKFLPKKPASEWREDLAAHNASKFYGRERKVSDETLTDYYLRSDTDPNALPVTAGDPEETLPAGQKAVANAARVMGGSATIQDPVRVMRQILQGKVTYDKGMIEFTDGGRAVIRLFEEADTSTVIHELAHLTRRWLDEIDSEVANRFVGATGPDWTVEQEEKWARAFERFCRDDKYAQSLDKQTRNMFRELKKWMAEIYKKIKGTSIDLEIDPATADFFSRLVSGKTRDEWAGAVPTGSPADEATAVSAVPTTSAAPAPAAAAPAPTPPAKPVSKRNTIDSPKPDWGNGVLKPYDHDVEIAEQMAGMKRPDVPATNTTRYQATLTNSATGEKIVYPEKDITITGISKSTSRIYVAVKIDDVEFIMYRSSMGTSGKTAMAWYFTPAHTGDWIVKGRLEEMERGYDSPYIQIAQSFLNNNYGPQSTSFGVDALYDFLVKKYGKTYGGRPRNMFAHVYGIDGVDSRIGTGRGFQADYSTGADERINDELSILGEAWARNNPNSSAAATAPDAMAAASPVNVAAAKKVRPSKSTTSTSNIDEATQLPMAFGSDAAKTVPAERKAKYVNSTPAPAKPRPARVKAPKIVAAVGKRTAENVEIGNLDTWTPALFAAYHRIDAGESIDSLNPILQDAAREAGLIVETRGVGGKVTEVVSKSTMKSAKQTIDLSDPFSYEQLANFSNSKPVYANKKLYQTSRIRVLTQSAAPTPNTGDVVIQTGQDIGDFVQEDVDIFLTKMPDTLPGEPEERIIDAYLNAIADGYTDRQAISMVSARIGKFYRMSAKEKAAFMSGKPMPKPGAIRRAVGKLSTVNQIGKQNQMYNITKIITRPLSDWIGNTVHFAISGNYAGVARQVKTANTALKILFMDPQEAKRVGMRVSDPLMKGLDTDLTAGLTNEFGGTVNKYGFAGHDLIMAEWAENSDLPWLAKIAAKAISNPRVQAASEAMDLLSRKNLGISIVNDEYVGALFRLREKLIADGLDPVDVMSRALEAARKRTGDPDVTAFSNRDIASVAGNDYGRWWGEQITIMRNRAKDEARRVLFVNSPQRNYEKSLGWAMYYFYWQSRSLNLAARSALQNPWVLSSYIKMWEGAQNEAERNGYPSTFVGMISYWGDPTNGLGWFGLSNPLGVLVPGFMMSEYYDATRDGEDDQPFYERLNTLIPASTIMTSAMAALGHTDQVPDLVGSRQVENLVMSVINWGNAHSIDFTNGRPVGSIVETVERQLMEGANAAARGLGLAEGQYNPYIPTTGQKDVIKSVVWQYAVEEYGDDIEQWTPKQWEEVSKAMTVIDEGIGESDFATKAYREWTTQLVKNRAINTVTPGGSVLRYGPRERARQLRDGSVPGTRPTNSGLAYEDVADLDRQRRQAGTQRDIVTATPDTRDILIQDQQADSASTPSQRAAADYYNLIVLRVPDDTEMYPDSMTFPTAIGAISAKTIRSMSEDERRNLANRFLDMTGMAFDQSMFYVNRDTAIASGKLPDLKAYDNYKQLIGQFETIADFRTWARDNNQYFAQLEDNARKRYADTDNLSGQALEDRLDGWAKSTRAYQAFRGKQYSAYDDKPSNATDLGPSIPPTEGPLLRTQVIQNEAAGLNSNTAASTNLALMGAGYRPTGSSSEAMAYTNWLQNNNGTADEWWRQQQGVEQMPSYFDR